MNRTIRYFNPNQLAFRKKEQRQQDSLALLNKQISAVEIQKNNSIFSDIDWSAVIIFETNGRSWRVE